MHYSSFLSAIALTLGMASASAVTSYPTCAQACLTSAAESAGCSITDAECQCGSGLSTITKDGTACLLKSTCSATDLITVESIAAAQCASVSSSSGSASASASASGSSVVSSTVAKATSSESSASASASASSSTGTASSSGSATSSASTTSETGAASLTKAGGAMVGLGFLAVLAL